MFTPSCLVILFAAFTTFQECCFSLRISRPTTMMSAAPPSPPRRSKNKYIIFAHPCNDASQRLLHFAMQQIDHKNNKCTAAAATDVVLVDKSLYTHKQLMAQYECYRAVVQAAIDDATVVSAKTVAGIENARFREFMEQRREDMKQRVEARMYHEIQVFQNWTIFIGDDLDFYESFFRN